MSALYFICKLHSIFLLLCGITKLDYIVLWSLKRVLFWLAYRQINAHINWILLKLPQTRELNFHTFFMLKKLLSETNSNVLRIHPHIIEGRRFFKILLAYKNICLLTYQPRVKNNHIFCSLLGYVPPKRMQPYPLNKPALLLLDI